MSALLSPESLDEFSFSDLLSGIDRQDREYFRGNRGERADNVVLVVGNTGAGKSTFINYAVGRSLTPDRKTVLGSTTYSCEDYVMKIGSNPLKSETMHFQTYFDRSSNLTYCDCPGFKDSRGALNDIENAYTLQKISNDCTIIKGVVVMISYHSLMADRGKSLQDAAAAVQGITGNKLNSKEVLDSLLILATRVPTDVTLEALRENLANSKQMPFGEDVLMKLNIYDVKDDRDDALHRLSIIQAMSSFRSFSSSFLSVHLSSSAEVRVTSGFSAESIRIIEEFAGSNPSHSIGNWKFASVGNRIKNMHKLKVLNIEAVDSVISGCIVNLTSKVQAMSDSDNNLTCLKEVGKHIPELLSIANHSIRIIEERMRVQAQIRQREEEARQEQQRQSELAEQLRLETRRAEEERARLQHERERIQAEHEAEERRIRASRHQGCIVHRSHLGFHPFLGYVQIQQPVWSCCGSSDVNNPTCYAASRYANEILTFTL